MTERRLVFPELSLVVLIGVSGSGKSTFARKHFKPTEVLSSDYCRGLVADDENDLTATATAFEVLHFIASKRLEAGRLTVVDATNVQREARAPLVTLARKYHCLPVAIVFSLPENVCQERNRARTDRQVPAHAIQKQASQLKRSIRDLKREGFRHIFMLESQEETDSAVIERQPLWNNLRHEHGPFDIVGDVHGCAGELEQLLALLGYAKTPADDGTLVYSHAQGRKAVFLGDFVDRGPRILDSYGIIKSMVHGGTGLCVPGNHDIKLMRKLTGRDVQVAHGMENTLAELDSLDDAQRKSVSADMAGFIDDLVSHYVLDDGKLVVAHAGMRQEMQGRGSGGVREFALYGETTGETDEFGLPVRYNWAAEYRGPAEVVYGHTPVPEPEWLNGTINVDTGCVFGGKLTALRYPERELVSVPSVREYCRPARPFLAPAEKTASLSAQQQHDDLLDIDDVAGKRIVATRLLGNVTIREENSAAALEVMSRFAINPKWLIYLPPTMSPPETSMEPGLLEYPSEVFGYFRSHGAPRVVCEEKHMGSRAVLVLCRDDETAKRRFGVIGEGAGACYTRTGRAFFTKEEGNLQAEFLTRVAAALSEAGFWKEFETDWVCLDCELMPWSAKAQSLIRQQYAAVGAASRTALGETVALLERAAGTNADAAALAARFRARAQAAESYVSAYRQYCWPVKSLDDLRLAPFHVLATEGRVHFDKDHQWHMEVASRISVGDPGFIVATQRKTVDVADEASVAGGIEWWQTLTSQGGEGMVVKPLSFVAHGKKGLLQPAIKCRGKEYLRMIYGPEYDAESNLPRLRPRRLGPKRSLALREFALGVESLERFVRREPLKRTHECVFGVLALESEPVDPRL